MVWLKRDSLTVPLASFRPEIPAAPSLPPTTDGTGTRSAEVLSQLRKLVSEGRFPPGSKLPAERKLAEQLTVGRPVIREAIKVLTTLGILESRGGSGTYVKSTQPAEPFAAGLPDVKLPFKMLHLLEVQEVIEPRAAWLAATRAGERE